MRVRARACAWRARGVRVGRSAGSTPLPPEKIAESTENETSKASMGNYSPAMFTLSDRDEDQTRLAVDQSKITNLGGYDIFGLFSFVWFWS